MIEVKVLDKMPNDIIEITKELRTKGHVQGVDFDFKYYPPKFNNFSGDPVYNRHAIFTFYKEELATWFSLRYL